MDVLKDAAERIFLNKERRRLALSRLPYEEKVRIVVKLQEMQAPILRARGLNPQVWRLGEDPGSALLSGETSAKIKPFSSSLPRR